MQYATLRRGPARALAPDAAELPKVSASRAILAAAAALVLGAGAATGAYALIDNGDAAAAAPRVIVVETPAPSADSDLRGSKASATGERAPGASPAIAAEIARRTDPHGAASSLRAR